MYIFICCDLSVYSHKPSYYIVVGLVWVDVLFVEYKDPDRLRVLQAAKYFRYFNQSFLVLFCCIHLWKFNLFSIFYDLLHLFYSILWSTLSTTKKGYCMYIDPLLLREYHENQERERLLKSVSKKNFLEKKYIFFPICLRWAFWYNLFCKF